MVRSDGAVKVLDFGLAKSLDPVAASSAAYANSPTATSPAMTARGVIVGTAAYMAPEQARGIAVDKRADLPANRAMKLMSLSISTAPEFLAGVPQTVFESADLAIAWGRSYDVSADGRRFLIALTKEPSTNLAPAQMIFVQNWFDELKRLVPVR